MKKNDNNGIVKTIIHQPPNFYIVFKIFHPNSVHNLFFETVQNNSQAKLLEVIVMVFNTTLNNISVISSLSVLLVEEADVLGENNRPATRH